MEKLKVKDFMKNNFYKNNIKKCLQFLKVMLL